MKDIELRLLALEAQYFEDKKNLDFTPHAIVQVKSICQEEIIIKYYPHGRKHSGARECQVDFDGLIQFVGRMSPKIEVYVTHAQCTEYLFAQLLTDERELAGGEDAKQRILREWLTEYPYLQKYMDNRKAAETLARLKPQANISEICRLLESKGARRY